MVLFFLAMLAQTDAGSFSSLLTALNIGLAGVGLIAFVKRWIVPGGAYEEIRKDRDRLLDENKQLRQSINDQFLPELQRSRAVTAALTQLVESVFEFLEKADK